jgi:hypothetical protein
MSKFCFKCGSPIPDEKDWYGLHHDCFKQSFQTPSLIKFQNLSSHRQSGETNPSNTNHTSFFHGKFRKYSSTLGETKYILKVEEEDYPELPATEYLCNQIFESLYIKVPSFHLILFEKMQTFATKNFMQDFPESNLVHVYHFLEAGMEHDCENLLRIVGEKTGRLTAQEDFVYLTLADSLIGNNDRHGRNLGLIQTSKGLLLSPFYDNPSYLGTEIQKLLKADHQPAGAIWTKSAREPTMKDYVQEWKRLKFDYIVQRFRLCVSEKIIQALIESSYLSQERKDAFSKLISKRIKELWS